MPTRRTASPLKTVLRLCWGCTCTVGNVVLWVVWLALAAVLAFQIHIAVTHEIHVPEAVIRYFEARLRERGWEVGFEGVKLDPHGHVAFQGLRVAKAGTAGPVLYCERADVAFNPWMAAAGFPEVERVQISNAKIELPPLLSPTGTPFELANRIVAVVEKRESGWYCEGLHAWVGSVDVELNGPLPAKESGPKTEVSFDPVHWGRPLKAVATWLARSDLARNPRVTVKLAPADDAQSRADVLIAADTATLPLGEFSEKYKDIAIEARQLRLHARVPKQGFLPKEVELTVQSLSGADVNLGRIETVLSLDHSENPRLKVPITNVVASVWDLRHPRLSLPFVQATVQQGEGGLAVAALTRLFGEPLDVRASGDPATRSGTVALTTQLSHANITGIGNLAGKPWGEILNPAHPAPLELSATFGAGGHLANAKAWLSSGPVWVRGVDLDAAASEITLDGNDLLCDRLLLKTGASEVRGSYAMDTRDLSYRFRLAGTFQPTTISGWFYSWWSRFWTNFAFPVTPKADTDILGRWRHPEETHLFIAVAAEKPKVKAAEFDTVKTRLFVRPHFTHALFVEAKVADRIAHATFDRLYDPQANNLVVQNFSATSNLPFSVYEGLFGEEANDVLSPFTAETPPDLRVEGAIRGPGAAEGPSRDLAISVRAPGNFTVYRFPLSDLKCEATLHNSDLHVRDLAVGFASGRVAGEFSLLGKAPDRTLTLDLNLNEAKLGEAIRILDKFGLERKGTKPKSEKGGRFQRENADGLVSGFVKATGLQGDALTFTGFGQATVTNAKLAEINLLGLLSQALRGVPLLDFTSFSLTAASADFELARDKLVLPKMRITGPSAEISARGDYSLKDKMMRIDATVFPFAESKNPFATTVGLVLFPLSAALELRLEGTLENPKWHFVRGPTELFRKLLPTNSEKTEPPPTAPAQPPTDLRRQ